MFITKIDGVFFYTSNGVFIKQCLLALMFFAVTGDVIINFGEKMTYIIIQFNNVFMFFAITYGHGVVNDAFENLTAFLMILI